MFKRMLLCLMAVTLLIASARAEGDPLRVMGWMDASGYPGATVEFVEGMGEGFDEIAGVIATRNDQVDIFVLPAYAGLFSLKKHGYYAPLDESAVLMNKLGDLYPAFQKALLDDEGHLVGWVLYADLIGMQVQADFLAENGLSVPRSFGEMLDECAALLEMDVLEREQSLLGYMGYTRQSVLELYMTLYIRSMQLDGGVVDFTRPEFVAMVERISTELPEKDPFQGDYPEWAVFELDRGFMELEDVLCFLPPVAADEPSAIETHLTLAVVNPYSEHKEEAIALLEWLATQETAESYIYDASLTEPMMSESVAREIDDLQADIARLEAIEDPTVEQADELNDKRAEAERLEKYRWRVAAETIALYQEQAKGLSILEASPVTYDEALRTATQRFLKGAFDAEGFARTCQDHISMIYQENGIEMK